MNQKPKRIMILVAIMTLLVIIGIGTYFGMKVKQSNRRLDPELAKTMTYEQVKTGEEKVKVDGVDFAYINFDAFFLRDLDGDGVAEGVRGTCKEIGKEDTLYMELNVLTNGYLENGKITINSENFYFNTAIVADKIVKQNYIGTNIKEIELKQMNAGEQKVLTGMVRSGDYSSEARKAEAIGNNINNYSKINSVTLTGTHVAEDGTRTQIEKTVSFNLDWYGIVETQISESKINQKQDINSIYNKETEEINLEFDIEVQETKNELILKKSYIEGTIPELNGYKPTKVEITGSDIKYNYNEDTMSFDITKEATINEQGQIIKNCYDGIEENKKNNKYHVKVIYPNEAYTSIGGDTIEYKVPIKAYYEGYNNPSSEFSNPYRSNIDNKTLVITFKKPEGNVAIFEVNVGDASKEKPLNIYNGVSLEEKEDYYTVTWRGSTGSENQGKTMTMKESSNEAVVSDEFIKSDTSVESMDDITSFVGIYFVNQINLLGENGEIRIYNDQTGELIETFNKDNWNKYSQSNPYKYKMPVKHIRVETSSTNSNESIYVYHIKEIDDRELTEKYTIEEFNTLQYIKSTLVGYLGEDYINTDTNNTLYKTPTSNATVSVDKSEFSTQGTTENITMTIETKADKNSKQSQWTNGAFLLKLPKDMIDVEINTVMSNNTNVKILSYEQYEEDGIKFIKINTENNTAGTYNIIIKCNMTPDPRVITKTEAIELYAYNENNSNYYSPVEDIYDINDNLNKEEMVNKNETRISLISPNFLLTSQTATNYDNKNSIAIAPQTAMVEKEQKTATVNVEINNNYSSTISEVKLLGKIPFEGNTYVINQNDMGSNFSATMTEEGILLPEELQGIAKVYYSTNENPSKDLNDAENEWKTKEEITDFSKVKTYLIDLENKILEKGENYTFSYNINLPENLNYNQISYSHHAVYFSLDTEEGKYRTQTEPNKLGFMVAKQYELNLIKYQKGIDKTLEGATYGIFEEGKEEAKTRVTNINGKIILQNLEVEKVYTIKELKSPVQYELNTEEIKFTVIEQEQELKINILSGTTKATSIVKEDGKDIVQIEVEDEVKANLIITKKEKETNQGLKNIKFKLTGKGLPSTGKIITTDQTGEIKLNGLCLQEEYTLEEIKADGYYLVSPIKFTINNQNREFIANIADEIVKNHEITTENYVPTLHLEIENEIIPTYDITLIKYAKGENTVLSGAQYKIEGEGILEGKDTYSTNEKGEINISNLYEYVEGQYITGIYTITEITPPQGYTLNSESLQFIAKRNELGELQIEIIKGNNIRTIGEEKDITIKQGDDGNTVVTIGIEDEPAFKIIKKDKETGKLLPNTKFQLIEIDSDDNEIGLAKDANGNYIGVNLIEGQTLEFSSEGETYPWQQREDKTWQSGGYNKSKAISNMTSNEFTIEENDAIFFEWAVSSESQKYDYLYYTIIDTRTGETVNTEVTKIGGNYEIMKYEDLTFIPIIVNLPNGNYKIQFTYRKDATGNKGLDAGFVRNISLIENPTIQTDKNGVISYGLKQGFYKAIEIESAEGYKLPENIEDRTYYFGIGASKSEERTWKIDTGNVFGYDGKDENDKMNDVIIDTDGNYIVAGYLSESKEAYISKIDTNFNEIWSKAIEGYDNYFNRIIEEDDVYTLVGSGSNDEGKAVDKQFGLIAKFDKQTGELCFKKEYNKTGWLNLLKAACKEENNGYIVANFGWLWGVDNGWAGILTKFDEDFNEIWATPIANNVEDIICVEDGYIVVGSRLINDINTPLLVKVDLNGAIVKEILPREEYEGYFYSAIKDDDGNIVVVGRTSTTASEKSEHGYIVKFDIEGNILQEEISEVQYSKMIQNSEGNYMLLGVSNNVAKIYNLDKNFEKNWEYEIPKTTLTSIREINPNEYIVCGDTENFTPSFGKRDGLLLKLKNVIISAEVPEAQEIEVLNELKQYQITTEIKEIDGVKGGTISGEGETPYEIVKHSDNSTKEIKIIPETGFKVIDITINGEHIPITTNSDGTVTLEKFVEMTEDKHIIATLSSTQSNIIVHHYIKDTTISVAPDEIKTGTIGKEYTTAPKMDVTPYELIKDETGEYVIPSNAVGMFTEKTQEVIYYYEEKDIPLTVHHYIEGTNTKVPLKDGSVAEDVTSTGKEKEAYETTSVEENLNPKYELVEMPENYKGTLEYPEVIVTYYYKLKEIKITTKVEGEGGTILGQGEEAYEKVEYLEDSKKDIIATPEEGYQVSKITVNGEEIEFTPNEDGTVTLDKFIEMTEDKEVVVSFEKIPTNVIVHYYIEGTETKVPSKDGNVVEDIEKIGAIGDIYVTKSSEDVAGNYELVAEPVNASGNMTEETIEVIYYYRMINADITSNITKDGTDKITKEDAPVTYTIEYTANVDQYIGNAKVIITDTLPFEIDEENENVDLKGGIYSKENNTITWEETIESIDTFANGAKEIKIGKEITVVYKTIDTSKTSFVNTVAGKIELDTTKQEEETEPADKVTKTEFTKEVTVIKTWNHTNNIYGNPSKVVLQVKNGETVVAEQEVTQEENWTHTFTGLTKYDEQGKEIDYQVGEREVVEGDLKYYEAQIDSTSKTINNTYIGPVITQEKTMETENGLSYVVEDEEITYTIKVENAGGLAKEVVVKDTIPEGTTFIENSIKVNGTESTLTEENLNDGIKVNVSGKIEEINGEATVSFKVRVNQLPEGILEKQIANTATVDETNTNTTTTVVNKAQVEFKKVSNPASGTLVKEGDEITYTIEVENTGTAPTQVTLKDTIPEGTTYVESSLSINRSMLRANESTTIEELANGITLDLLAQEKVTIIFKVTVNDLENGAEIRNVATVNEMETNETVHNYVEPIISQSKFVKTEKGLDYVVEGEKLTYTILLNNHGGLAKEVTLKDSIPEGTSFVEGSIKVNGIESTANEENLKDGIKLTAPVGEEELPCYASVSFEVIVNQGKTGDIKNTATVDDKTTNEVKTPVVIYEKVATTSTGKNEVTVGDTISYKIKVTNTGTVTVNNITVKDQLPEETKLLEIGNNGQEKQKEITWVIDEIIGGETKEVGFNVQVEYAKEEYTITNIATVDDKTTNETENPYKKPEPELTSKVEKIGTDKVTSKDTTVYYEVKFTAIVEDFVGKAKVTMVDTLPYGIEESKSKLAGGTYDDETKTITWEEEIEDIHTFNAGKEKEIAITKVLELSYQYGNLDNMTGNMINKVDSKIELQEPKTEDPTTYETVKEDDKEAEKETIIELPTEVIVHHYFYDDEAKLPTTVKLAEDETIIGKVTEAYHTTPSSEVTANYVCVNQTPEKYQGNMTENTIEVIYYYSLTTPTVTNTMEKTAVANKVVEETILDEETGEEMLVTYPVLTQENDYVTYNINYQANIKNYIGKAVVEVVDTLPAKIDLDKSNLNGGIYNETTRTITWKLELENINTYTKGIYPINFVKEIKLVYVDQNVTFNLENTVTGITKLYYPEEHPTKGNKEQLEETAEDEAIIKQEYKVNLTVEKVWEDNDNLKGKRPESVEITIKEMLQGEVTTQLLNKANNWTYVAQNLPKYDEQTGRKLIYVVTENEVNEGDLEYYELPTITQVETDSTYQYTVKNSYKLLDTDLNTEITKVGTEEITSSKQTVNYTIHFTAEIVDYIGAGKVTIVDTLPYEIDVAKSNLKGGHYNEEDGTITWEQELPHINTEVSNENYVVDITKQISVVYKNLASEIENTKIDKIKNMVRGKVELYETEEKDEKETTFGTNINITGKVVVRYVDKTTGKDIIVKVLDEEGQLVEGTYAYEINGRVGEDYQTELKDIENYIYVESTDNEAGIIKEEEQEVIYYYEKIPTQVIVKYQDKEGNPLTEDDILEGKLDDPYATEPKDIENYKLIIIPDNKEGTMEKDTITVIYVYEKIPARVIVKYLEKDTENVLEAEDITDGYVGDKYETQRKAITNYRKAEPEPDNASGIMKVDEETNNTITVIYYYERIPSGIVTVKYVDADTKEEITYKDEETQEEKTYGYEIKGYVGDNYTAEEKEIPYYTLVKEPINKQGTLKESGDIVIYYYRKQKFNMEITKEITKVVMNGEEKSIQDGKLSKIEIIASKIPTTELEITYSIKVRNTEELAGTAKILEMPPNGYMVSSKTPRYWIINAEGNLETTVELKPGEEKTLEVVLRWNNTQDNFGEAQNTAKIVDTQNEANYEETSKEDNISVVSIITTVKTGSNENIIMIVTCTMVSITLFILVYVYETDNRKRKIAMRMIKLEGKDVVIRKEKWQDKK